MRVTIENDCISDRISRRISAIRFPIIALVVFIHANNPFGENIKDPYLLSNVLRYFISVSLGGVAVPLFFVLSGILFFKNIDQHYGLISYYTKIRSRGRTLLFPYIFWNLIAFSLICFAQQIGISGSNTYSLLSGSIIVVGDRIFGFSGVPFAFQFWFIRDLIIAIIISPFVHFLIKKAVWPCIIFLTILWMQDVICLFHSSSTPLFFFMGATLSMKKFDLQVLDQSILYFAGIYVTLGIICAFLRFYVPSLQLLQYLLCIVIITGIISAWILTSRLSQSMEAILLTLSNISFFVFAAHEPLLAIVQKIYMGLFPPVKISGMLIFYFFPSIIVIILLITLALILQKHFTCLFSFLTGGRGNRNKYHS